MKRDTEGQSDRLVGLPFFFARALIQACLWVALWGWGAMPAAASDPSASTEFRGLWVVRGTLTSPEGIARAVTLARQGGFNAILVQVRGRADAYYGSRLAPRGEDVEAPQRDFDPLTCAIQEGRKAGLEVHAWVNLFLAWNPTRRPPESPDHVLTRHPEWFMRSSDGIDMGRMDLDGVDLVRRGVEGRYLSPAVPEVREHLVDVVEEIVRGYDVDGVHLDYVRYPNRHYDFGLLSRAAFLRQYQFDPLALLGDGGKSQGLEGDRLRMQALWQRWRTEQVSKQVEAIRALLDRLAPWAKLSAAVKPDFEDAYYENGQDWIGWINRGIVDFVVPMFYVGSSREIETQIKEARKYVKKGHLYAGIGVWNQSPSETAAQIEVARRLALQGVALFSYDSLIGGGEILDRLREGAFRHPARVPRMRWKKGRDGSQANAR